MNSLDENGEQNHEDWHQAGWAPQINRLAAVRISPQTATANYFDVLAKEDEEEAEETRNESCVEQVGGEWHEYQPISH